MKNIYLFIIWNKALFQREKIVNDLKNSFVIITDIFVEWTDYDRNLKAFYGSKIDSTKDKISFIGKGIFNLIVVQDLNPKYETRKVFGGKALVNSRIFDKKDLYREWTGRDFRVHSSQTPEETKHDLTILLGPDYENKIYSFDGGEIVKKDTIAIDGPQNVSDFENCLNNLNAVYSKNGFSYNIYAYCRLDIERIFSSSITLDDETYQIHIYGEAEGDIPHGLCQFLLDSSLLNKYENLKDKRIFYREHSLEEEPKKKNSLRKGEKITFLKRIKKEIRYVIAHIKY